VLVEAGDAGEVRHGTAVVRLRPTPLPPRLTAAARAAHRAFVSSLGEAIWNRYLPTGAAAGPSAQTA